MKGIFATLLLAFCLTATAQQNPPDQAPLPQNPEQAPVAADKTFEGHLTKVNIDAKLITLKGENDKEMMFVYNNDTTMTGIDHSPQGLTGKTGTRMKITYKESRGINLATKIEASSTERTQ